MSILHVVWNYLFGWAGVDILIGFAAVAVAVLTPAFITKFIPDLRKWAIAAAVVAFTLAGAIAHGYKLGRAELRAEWDAALAREADRGEKARDNAVRRVGPESSDRSLFRGDPFNRDRRTK